MIPMLVVPTLTRHDLLTRMLESIDAPIGRLVVIDNSGRGVQVADGPWDAVTVLPMPVNFGVAASWNLAVKMAHRHPWVMIASDDVVWPAGALAGFEVQSAENTLVLSETWPHWCAFTLGMRVVSDLGLFDEGYYPAYYEDTEFERRMDRAGMRPVIGPKVFHDNASTLNTPHSPFSQTNGVSLAANKALFHSDVRRGFDPFFWRAQAWT
jgi:GT2 family glycosyltransferase